MLIALIIFAKKSEITRLSDLISKIIDIYNTFLKYIYRHNYKDIKIAI